jgi:excinuclease UvrABC nuclease subunit
METEINLFDLVCNLQLKIYYPTSDFDMEELMGKSGVYFLIYDNKIEYIGKSNNIGKRLKNHHIFDRLCNNAVLVYECSKKYSSYISQSEINLIKLLNPTENKAHKNKVL